MKGAGHRAWQLLSYFYLLSEGGSSREKEKDEREALERIYPPPSTVYTGLRARWIRSATLMVNPRVRRPSFILVCHFIQSTSKAHADAESVHDPLVPSISSRLQSITFHRCFSTLRPERLHGLFTPIPFLLSYISFYGRPMK